MRSKHRSGSACDGVLWPRMSGAWRSGVAAVAFALMVVACSSGSDTSTGESPEETATSATDEQNDTAASDGIEIRPEDSALVDVLATGLGVEAGFVALVDALGRGYDITTIMSAVADRTLQTNGQIIVSGELIAPTRPASVLLIVEDAAAVSTEPEGLRSGLVYRPAGLDEDVDGVNGRGLFTLLSDARTDDPSSSDVDSGIQLTRLIVALARSGYSMDQIIQALVFNENVWEARSGCTAIADGLDLITPAYPDEGGCALTVAQHAAEQDDDIDAQDNDAETDEPASEPALTFIDGVYEKDLPMPEGFVSGKWTVQISNGTAEVLSEQVQAQTMEAVGDRPVCTFDDRGVLTGTDDDLTDGVINVNQQTWIVYFDRSNFSEGCNHPFTQALLTDPPNSLVGTTRDVSIEIIAQPDGSGANGNGVIVFENMVEVESADS